MIRINEDFVERMVIKWNAEKGRDINAENITEFMKYAREHQDEVGKVWCER